MGVEGGATVDVKGGEETIVNVTSAGAHGVGTGASGYFGSKFALLRFTEFLMVEHGEEGLLAYSVHPCGAATELGLGVPERMHFGESVLREIVTWMLTSSSFYRYS